MGGENYSAAKHATDRHDPHAIETIPMRQGVRRLHEVHRDKLSLGDRCDEYHHDGRHMPAGQFGKGDRCQSHDDQDTPHPQIVVKQAHDQTPRVR